LAVDGWTVTFGTAMRGLLSNAIFAHTSLVWSPCKGVLLGLRLWKSSSINYGPEAARRCKQRNPMVNSFESLSAVTDRRTGGHVSIAECDKNDSIFCIQCVPKNGPLLSHNFINSQHVNLSGLSGIFETQCIYVIRYKYKI